MKTGIGLGILLIDHFDWSIFGLGDFSLVHYSNSVYEFFLEAHAQEAVRLLHSSISQLAVSVGSLKLVSFGVCGCLAVSFWCSVLLRGKNLWCLFALCCVSSFFVLSNFFVSLCLCRAVVRESLPWCCMVKCCCSGVSCGCCLAIGNSLRCFLCFVCLFLSLFSDSVLFV